MLPFDVELCDPGFVREDVPDEFVHVVRRIRGCEGGIELSSIPRLLERSFLKLGIDVVSNPHKLLLVVRASQQDYSHPDEV